MISVGIDCNTSGPSFKGESLRSRISRRSITQWDDCQEADDESGEVYHDERYCNSVANRVWWITWMS